MSPAGPARPGRATGGGGGGRAPLIGSNWRRSPLDGRLLARLLNVPWIPETLSEARDGRAFDAKRRILKDLKRKEGKAQPLPANRTGR